MGPVLVALYEDHEKAERVRTELVMNGFPTDRVELTSRGDSLQAKTLPGDSFGDKVANYFETLFDEPETKGFVDVFTRYVQQGDSAITVHPRFDHEIATAREILLKHKPRDLGDHGRRIVEGQHGATQPSTGH